MNDTLPLEFWHGVDQFNQGQFYACHDTLEALWMEALQPEKTFYQGILQIAVALHHLENQNVRGAMILLGEGIQRLRNYQPDYGEIDVTQVLTQSASLLLMLQQADVKTQTYLVQQLHEAIQQSEVPDLNLSGGNIFPLPKLRTVTTTREV